MNTTIEEYENNELTDCYLCGEQFSVKHFKEEGMYKGIYGYDEPHPSYYKAFCKTCNNTYKEIKQLSKKQLLPKIRKALKRNCKTLSIKVSYSVWDIGISPLIKDHNYRNFNQEELAVLVEWRIIDSMEYKTNLATVKDLYYFYLIHKDKIEALKEDSND